MTLEELLAQGFSEDEAMQILETVNSTGLLDGQVSERPLQTTLSGALSDIHEQEFFPIVEDASIPVEFNFTDIPDNDSSRYLYGNIGGVHNEELQRIITGPFDPELQARAQQELELRGELQEQSFIERLGNSNSYERTLRSFTRAPAQTINGMINGLPELGAFAIDRLAGNSEIPMQDFFADTVETQEQINRRFGVSDPITTGESLAEVWPGALMGGVGGAAFDFLADQGIRELTDDRHSEYQTIFDRLNLSGADEEPTLGPIAAMAAVGVGIASTPATIRWWNNRNPTNLSLLERPSVDPDAPDPVALNRVDPDAPDDIYTITDTRDIITAGGIDQQTALANIGERMGIPNMDFVRNNIDLQTHAAAGNRAGEAMCTGLMSTLQRQFDSPTPPRLLYDTYHALPDDVRGDVSQYINLLDMRDDTLIAIRNGTDPQAQTRLARLNSQIHQIRSRTPAVVDFSTRYNEVTGAVRTFMEDGMFSQQQRIALDQDRPNYVPLYIEPVDPNASFLNRLQQAGRQNETDVSDIDWFLQRRNSTGAYDISRRGDPFEHLMSYTNAALISQMRNDTRLAFIDGMLGSNAANGYQFTRLVQEGETATNGGRIVSVFRNGQREQYIMEGLTADLLQFDPQISQHPWLYGPRRFAEMTSVGAATVTFAPITFLRDVGAGRVARPEGVIAPTIGQAASVIPEQVFRRAQLAMSDFMLSRLDANGQAFPQLFGIDATAQRRFADLMSSSYTNSLYSQIRSAGGFNASDIVSNTRMQTGRLTEIANTIGRTVEDNPVLNKSFIRS